MLPATNFTADELGSDHFEALRQNAMAVIYENPIVAGVFHAANHHQRLPVFAALMDQQE